MINLNVCKINIATFFLLNRHMLKKDRDRNMKITCLTLLLTSIFFVHVNCDSMTVNTNIHIEDGDKVNHDIRSVNGAISVGDGCQIMGNCQTVNGSIRIGENTIVEEVQTVNGEVFIAEKVKIEENIETVNGAIKTSKGTIIEGKVKTVNGGITLKNTKVSRDIVTTNGNITLDDKSHIKGDLIVKHKRGRESKHLKIELLNGSVVDGDIFVEQEDRQVIVILKDNSEVHGKVINAEIIKES